MKKRTLFFGLVICVMVCTTTLLTGCKKEDGGSDATAAAGTIKAKINGSNFTSMAMASAANRVSLGGGRSTITEGAFNMNF